MSTGAKTLLAISSFLSVGLMLTFTMALSLKVLNLMGSRLSRGEKLFISMLYALVWPISIWFLLGVRIYYSTWRIKK